MNTIVVWVLIVSFGRGPMVVDNIATKDNCVALGKLITDGFPSDALAARCIAVRKVKTTQ